MISKVAKSDGHLLSAKEMKSRMRALFMEQLEPLGFKGTSTTWIRKRCPEAYDWIAVSWLTYGKDADFYAAEIHVGIHSEPVERLFAELAGDSYNSCRSPTVQRLLGYMMPQRHPDRWILSRKEFPELVVIEMVKATVNYGLPFMENFSTWGDIYDGIARYGMYKSIQLPITKYLMGEYRESIELIKTELTKIEGDTHPASDLYRKRAAALMVLCDAKRGKLGW